MTFDQWFDANGYSEEHREMFRTVWDAALDQSWRQIEAARIPNPTGNGWSDQLAQNNGLTMAQNVIATAMQRRSE